jgi:cytochrome c
MAGRMNGLLGLRAVARQAFALALIAAGATAHAQDGTAGDAVAGATSFLVCSACHTTTQDGAALIGPNLWHVVGRAVASKAGFDYSPELKAVGGEWTTERLDQFLKDPAGFAPGTRMGFVGVADATERANLIAYLSTLTEGAAIAVAAPAVDYGPDWPPGPGSAEAGQLCNSCHSLTIVKAQKLSRKTWDKLLVWMVEEQGMAEQSPETRALILDYLATHFGAPE